MAKAIFYREGMDCALAVENERGGMTYIMFDGVSDMVNYCRDRGIEAEVETEG